MEEIGDALKEARSRLGLTLEQAERSTRIRSHYLEALEAGDFESLPSPVQARGFLRNYAEFLGIDSQPLLDAYTKSISTQRTIPLRRNNFNEAATRPSVAVRSRRPRWLSMDLFVAGFITLAVVAILIWGFGRLATSLREQAQESSSFLIPTATEPLEPTPAGAIVQATQPAAANPTPALDLPVAAGDVVDVRLLVERRALVIALVDGEEVYRGRPAPGELLEFLGEQVVEITTGNGGGLRAFLRGQDQGLMGELGEVVTVLWTLEGAITPTPRPTVES